MARGYASGVLTGLAISGVTLLLAPALSGWGRSTAKAVIRNGLIAFDTGRTRLAELSEQLEDLLAEAQAELVTERLAGRNDGERPK